MSVFLAAAWIIFLISAAGIQEDSWFLFGVGAVGMIQNILIAGVSRDSATQGIPLRQLKVFGKNPGNERRKVMGVLLDMVQYKRKLPEETIETTKAAIALRKEFLPDEALRVEEWFQWLEIDEDLGRSRPRLAHQYQPEV